MKLSDTPVTQHHFSGVDFFLKRDDQLHSHFSGNKARKLMALLQLERPHITTLIGHGSAQANSLYSLAALAAIRGWKLEFYVDRIPTWLKENPIGNYRGALELGANIIETAPYQCHPQDYIRQHRQADKSCLLVPEGGSSTMAEEGVKGLANEILSWTRFETNKQFVVALPSGTGTTALYLHKHLAPHGIEVLTCACVGGEDYLTEQMNQLGENEHPKILSLANKHHFGKLYQADYQIWQQLLQQTDIEFDLLYDPLMWQCLLPWQQQNQDKTILYVHQGGVLGNESMLPRYQRKFGDSL